MPPLRKKARQSKSRKNSQPLSRKNRLSLRLVKPPAPPVSTTPRSPASVSGDLRCGECGFTATVKHDCNGMLRDTPLCERCHERDCARSWRRHEWKAL